MDLIPDFIKRKQGKVPIVYELPELEPILKDTYGVIVYQEQVMAIANKVAGFSLGQADILRRAMGKKKPEEMEKLRVKFMEGARQNKIADRKAEKLYELIHKFAG
jgi:DNA polymerase-3 subunit alpha